MEKWTPSMPASCFTISAEPAHECKTSPAGKGPSCRSNEVLRQEGVDCAPDIKSWMQLKTRLTMDCSPPPGNDGVPHEALPTEGQMPSHNEPVRKSVLLGQLQHLHRELADSCLLLTEKICLHRVYSEHTYRAWSAQLLCQAKLRPHDTLLGWHVCNAPFCMIQSTLHNRGNLSILQTVCSAARFQNCPAILNRSFQAVDQPLPGLHEEQTRAGPSTRPANFRCVQQPTCKVPIRTGRSHHIF